MAKTIEQQFKKLNEVEHVLLRPGRYIGSVKPHEGDEWMPNEVTKKMEKRGVVYNPGFLKLFDEVISNSVDHSKRPEGKHLDTIKVEVDTDTGEISIYDNGGIPVVIHQELNQYIPEMIFELRAGSNFDDDDESTLTGQNGEGAGLTNIFSKRFIVETCDSKKKFKMVFEENSQLRNPPQVTPAEGSKGYTKITYLPDYEKLGMSIGETFGLDQDNYDMIFARVVEIAACNTHLKVSFNGERIPTRSFKDYIEMFTNGADYAYDEGEHFKVGVAPSDDGFQHISFVNTTRTKIGGTHILYVGMQIWERLREHIKKKHKVDVKPSELRQHMTLFIDATIVNPRYSSQTKDDLITESKDYKTSYEVSEKFINKIIKLEIIQNILDWAAAKQAAEDAKLARGAAKDTAKLDPRRVDKFADAIEKKDRSKCILFLTEGDSAAKAVQAGRGKNPYIGSMPLKGKPLNVREKDILEILGVKKGKKVVQAKDDGKKKEPNIIQKILTIMGLEIGVPVRNIEQLRFGRVAFSTDADVDGAHICGLLMNLFEKFWPELFEMGVINIFRTPLVKVFIRGKDTLEFFTEREFRDWEATEGVNIRGWTRKYYKGLGTSSASEFTEYLSNMENYLFRIDIEDDADRNAIDLAFNSQRADDRKVWLETPAENFEDFIVDA